MTKLMNHARGMALGALAMAAFASTAAAQQARLEGEAPLRFVGDRLVVTATLADGGKADFLLTTSEMSTVLTESFLATHGRTAEVLIGPIPVVMADARSVPDSELRLGGLSLAGMIGLSTVSQYDLLVDVPGRRLALKTPARRVEWAGVELSDPVRLRVYHGVAISLDLEVNGQARMATFDLQQAELLLNAPLAGTLGIDGTGPVSVRIGDVELSGLPARVSDHPIFERWDPNGAGFLILGAPIARDCAISLSWMHQEVRTCVR